jgi:hypothetical protein
VRILARFEVGSFLVGLAVGAVVAGGHARGARPLAKLAIRVGVEGYDRARRAAAALAEDVEDLIAETVHEMQAEGEAAPIVAKPGNDA